MAKQELITIRSRAPESWWGRMTRSFRLGPFSLKDPALARLFGGGGPTLSGVSVSEANVLSSSAVWSAVTMIADDIASLPLMLYKRLPDGGKDRFDTHSLYRLLHDAPNPEMDAMVCWRTMQTHALIFQNAYAEIERDQVGRPVAIWPLVPERVVPERRSGVLGYRVSNPSGSDVWIPAADMLHIVGQSHDGMVGNTIVSHARESFALGLAAEKFGAAFFGNGGAMGGVISVPTAKPADGVAKAHNEQVEARHQGVARAYRIMTLYQGAKFEQVGVKPDEGQFNETRIFQIREVARWFKIPPHKLGDLADATYSNVEQMDAAYLSSCIRPWLVLWRQQLSRKLISRLEQRQQFIEHDTHGFLAVDAAGRSALYSALFQVGAITPNDIRGFENQDPIDGGGRSFVPLNMMPLDRVDEYMTALIDGLKAKAAPPPPPPPPPGDGEDPPARALVQTIERLTEEKTRADEARRQAEQRAEDLSGANTALEIRATKAEARATQEIELRAGVETALAAEKAEHVRTINEADIRKEADGAEIERLGTEVEAVRAKGEQDFETAKALGESAIRHADAREAELKAAMATRESDHVEALAAAFRSSEQALASEVALRKDVEALCLTAQGEKVQAEQRAEAAERDRDIAEHARAEAVALVEARRTAENERAARVIAAHRALVVEAVRRQLVKECDRVRRHQATPQKIRAWMETFYQDHAESVAEALRPVLAAEFAWRDDPRDPQDVAAAMAERHCRDSREALTAVLAVEDFHGVLERTLQRWEQRRPDQLADTLLAEGVQHARTL